MKKHLSYLMIAATFLSSSYAFAGSGVATGTNTVAVQGTLGDLQDTIRSAVQKADELYRANGGVPMPSNQPGTDQGTFYFINGNHKAVQYVAITNTYQVAIKLNGEYTSFEGQNVETGISPALRNVEFLLIPITDQSNTNTSTGRDLNITQWDCITNADWYNRQNTGQTDPIPNKLSYTAGSTNNIYLNQCVYLNGPNLGTVSSTVSNWQ